MYDLLAIKERADLLALVGDTTQLRKVAAQEYAGPCPQCGGDDRFHVTPTWFFCRQCHDKRGDVIEYLQWRDGIGFLDACAALGGEKDALEGPGLADAERSRARTRGVRRKSALERRTEAPSEAWQAKARGFCSWAAGQLWETPAALAYLHGRGLIDETIRAAGLGWNPRQWDCKADTWGLDGKSVRVAIGLVSHLRAQPNRILANVGTTHYKWSRDLYHRNRRRARPVLRASRKGDEDGNRRRESCCRPEFLAQRATRLPATLGRVSGPPRLQGMDDLPLSHPRTPGRRCSELCRQGHAILRDWFFPARRHVSGIGGAKPPPSLQ